MTFSEAANLEQVWWEQNISENSRSLIELPITDTIFTDGSSMGWGASSQFGKINGRQIDKERDLHIDNLELLAILINFESFKINFLRKHVKIMSDSAIAISHINNAGCSKSITYHEIAKKKSGKGQKCKESGSQPHIYLGRRILTQTKSRQWQ